METPLGGKGALVAGATRGAGRGIAVQLGAAGATVYVTGRTTRSEPSEMNRPETIEETAALVSAAGGLGIPVRVDHTIDQEIAALLARIQKEQRRLDVLVNILTGRPVKSWKSFWHLPLDEGRAFVNGWIWPHVARKSGGIYDSWSLSEEYGFTDLDGTRPNMGRYLSEHHPQLVNRKPPTAFEWKLVAASRSVTS